MELCFDTDFTLFAPPQWHWLAGFVKGVAPVIVDLITPEGSIDASAAGVRANCKLNIAAAGFECWE